jgi:DNA mismatch endonuclease (patch repair protein)
MRAQRERDTHYEQELRRELHGRGYRFRIHQRVPGSRREIDIAFPRAKVAVFVDGCFWHWCPEHGTLPKANRSWWAEKLDQNRRRDRDTDRRLAEIGWMPIRIWEHMGLSDAAERIAGFLS